MKIKQSYPTVAAFLSAAIMMPFALAMYLALEPMVVQGQSSDTDSFTVTQQITGEISFEVAANDVTMAPTIPGLTGGTALGSTSVRVSTNNTTGYTLDIAFEDVQAMQQNNGSANIPNLGTTASGDYDLSGITTGDAAFAVTASSSNAVSQLLDDGAGGCQGSTPSVDTCFVMESDATNAFTLVDRSTETLSEGELTDIGFIVKVGANPSPTLPVDFYTATATLTATENS